MRIASLHLLENSLTIRSNLPFLHKTFTLTALRAGCRAVFEAVAQHAPKLRVMGAQVGLQASDCFAIVAVVLLCLQLFAVGTASFYFASRHN